MESIPNGIIKVASCVCCIVFFSRFALFYLHRCEGCVLLLLFIFFSRFLFPPQVETVFGSPNMTVAYHVTAGDTVYPPSTVLDALESYGRDKLIADLRQYLPMVTALPVPVAPWRPSPTRRFQLKTGQRLRLRNICRAGELMVGLCFSSAVCGQRRRPPDLLVLSDDGTKAGEGVR